MRGIMTNEVKPTYGPFTKRVVDKLYFDQVVKPLCFREVKGTCLMALIGIASAAIIFKGRFKIQASTGP
jgi:hypothetical protein